jgi:hypothetical protein
MTVGFTEASDAARLGILDTGREKVETRYCYQSRRATKKFMDPESPPPTEHILRPHHVALLTIFILTFKTFHSTTLPSPFILHLYRLLLNEVSEVGILIYDYLSFQRSL